MAPFIYKAEKLYRWLEAGEDIVVVDVRNPKEFVKFKVEGPRPFSLFNIPYFDFMEFEEESLGKLPPSARIRIVCAKEASAKYVAEIVSKNGFEDVGYLGGGINTWGNLLVPKQIISTPGYELYQFIRPGKASCSYGLLSGDEIMFFDPSRNLDFYLGFAGEKNARILKTFETHLQADYIAGSRLIAEQTGAVFLANEADFTGARIQYTPLEDMKSYGFSQGGPEIKALFTPGHTPGSTSFLIDGKFLISGDTVFISSIGRPDLGGKAEEWSALLFASLQKIRSMNADIMILPAHFMDWEEAGADLVFQCTLAGAIARNQDIYAIDSPGEFLAFILENMRPQPEEYKTIRLINANLEQADEEQQNILDIGKNECAASAYAGMKSA